MRLETAAELGVRQLPWVEAHPLNGRNPDLSRCSRGSVHPGTPILRQSRSFVRGPAPAPTHIEPFVAMIHCLAHEYWTAHHASWPRAGRAGGAARRTGGLLGLV